MHGAMPPPAHFSSDEAFTTAIPYYVYTAGTPSAVGHSVPDRRQYTRKRPSMFSCCDVRR